MMTIRRQKQPQMIINKSTIDKAIPKNETYTIWDAGFGFRVYPSGVKTFVVYYLDINKKKHEETIANVNDISIKDARYKAEIKRHKSAEYSLGQYAFDETFTRYLDDKINTWKPNSQKMFLPLVDKYIKTSFLWVQRDLNNIQKQQFFKYFEGLYKTPDSQKNNIYLLLNGFFKWCVKKGLVDKNSIEGVWDVVPSQQRDRVLTMDELHNIWCASSKLPTIYSAYIRTLILTGQRRSEVANMELTELNLNDNFDTTTHGMDATARCWTIPASKTKGKREQQLPLTDFLLHEMQPLIDHCKKNNLQYIFSKHSRNGFTQFASLKNKLSEATGIQDWRLHDIRRSVSTHMVSLGIDPFLVKRLLNHSVKADLGVTSIYVKNTYMKEKLDALQKWVQQFIHL